MIHTPRFTMMLTKKTTFAAFVATGTLFFSNMAAMAATLTFVLHNPAFPNGASVQVIQVTRDMHDCTRASKPRVLIPSGYSETIVSVNAPWRLALSDGNYCYRRELVPFPPELTHFNHSPSPEFDAFVKAMNSRKWTAWTPFSVRGRDTTLTIR